MKKKIKYGFVFFFLSVCFFNCTKEDGITPNWPKKAELPGNARETAVAFVISDKAYIGTGFNGSYLKDFWEYDPAANAWTQKTDFGGTARYRATGFSVGTNGYIGLGYDGTYKNDIWEYNPSKNTWVQKLPLPSPRSNAVAFVIGNKAYVGTGYYHNGVTGIHYKDIWQFTPDSNTWVQKTSILGNIRSMAFTFSIGNKGYLGGGYNASVYFSDFYEYDPATNAWTQRTSFPTLRSEAASFVINEKGYVGTGYDGDNYKKDFYEYNPAADKWQQKIDFVGSTRIGAVGFSVKGRGYIATGRGLDYEKNMFEYWP